MPNEAPAEPRTLAERIRAELPRLTVAERRVARALLADYPLAGLEPVAALAQRAQTSAPTVLRLVGKLDLDGYPSFQQAIKAELAARLSSPLTLYPHLPPGPEVLPRMRESLTDSVRRGLEQLDGSEVDTPWGCSPSHSVRCGRSAAGSAACWPSTWRCTCGCYARAWPGAVRAGRPRDHAAGHGRRAVLVAFDYRRYQRSTIEFGVSAAGRGAAVVLFTDHYLSPLAAEATVVLATTVEAPTPFAVLTPALAVVEAMVAGVVNRLGSTPRERLAAFDDLDTDVIDGGPPEKGSAMTLLDELPADRPPLPRGGPRRADRGRRGRAALRGRAGAGRGAQLRLPGGVGRAPALRAGARPARARPGRRLRRAPGRAGDGGGDPSDAAGRRDRHVPGGHRLPGRRADRAGRARRAGGPATRPADRRPRTRSPGSRRWPTGWPRPASTRRSSGTPSARRWPTSWPRPAPSG